MYQKCNIILDKIKQRQSILSYIIKIVCAIHIYSVAIYGQGDLFIGGTNRPVADAGRDIKTISKGSIFLDGSRSFVGDGSKIKYYWMFAPGLAQKIDNDLSSEISVETYGTKYIKSVETYRQVLDLKLSENIPGTKLEVILKIKDRIGFEDSDTIIVEYYDPTIKTVIAPDTLLPNDKELEVPEKEPSFFSKDSFPSVILVQEIISNTISSNDAHIINSIIKDQIRAVGFNYNIYLNKDSLQIDKTKNHKSKCKTNDCVSKNANIVNAKYAITWEFANAVDMLSLRIFETGNPDNFLGEVLIPKPYLVLNELGIYGLEEPIREGTSDIMSEKPFKDNISTFNRLLMKNDKWIAYGKYPIILGATYLLFDNIFSKEDEESVSDIPPGFPHD